ncbi:MAG: hypothetical protein ACKVI2_05130, partial [Candidatus Pelagibacterales bacterium]
LIIFLCLSTINHNSIKMKKQSWIIFGIIFIIISALYLVNKNTKQDSSESKPDVYMDEQYDQDND